LLAARLIKKTKTTNNTKIKFVEVRTKKIFALLNHQAVIDKQYQKTFTNQQ
jgi:hypothetical protein